MKRAQSSTAPSIHEAFVVPKGAPVHSTKTGEWKPAGRTQTVYPWGVSTYTTGTVVHWAGTGGYWRRVSLTRGGEFVDYWPGEEAKTDAV